jgi:hypothetical protein
MSVGCLGGWSCLGAASSGPGRGLDVLLLFDRILRTVSKWSLLYQAKVDVGS